MLEEINKMHQILKKNKIQTFLIIIVLILLVYYVYNKYFKKEHFKMGADMGAGAIVSYSSLCIVCMIIPYLVLYYIIKIANKNAIKESNQSSQSKS